MSQDIQEYWRQIRQLESTLPEFVWVVAGNAITQVAAAIAARLLHAGSHRVATEDEVESQQAREKDSAKQAKRARMRRIGQAVVVVADQILTNEDGADAEIKSGPSRRRRR